MQLQSLAVGHVDEFWTAFQAATAARTEALITLLDHITFVHREVVGFLASEESRYVTGQSLLVDGGLVRGV